MKIGVIGLGHWGPNLVRILARHPEAVLLAVCDKDAECRERISGLLPRSCGVVSDPEEIFADERIEAVAISVPATQHAELTQRAITAGKHVFCEKPLAFDPDTINAIQKMAEEHNVSVLVDFTFLFNKGVHKVKDYLREGKLGSVYYLQATRTHLGLVREDVDAMWDLAPHDVAIMNYLLDEVPRRVAVVHASPLNSGRSDVAFIGLYYPSGIIGQIHVSWVDSNKIRKFQVIGSKARVVFDDLNNLEPVRFFETGIGVSRSVAQDFGDFRYLLSDGDIISPKIAMEEPLQAAVSSFLRLVHDGEETIADLSFTRDVVRTLAAASRSVAADGAPQEV